MEVSIDDMLVKTKEHPDHMKHLQETFELLRMNGMKLNPLKCAFDSCHSRVIRNQQNLYPKFLLLP